MECVLKDHAWADFRQRLNRQEVFSSYFGSENAKRHIGFEHIKKALSIGPGEGEMDTIFLSQCPNIKEYTCIEPMAELLNIAQNRLTTNHPMIRLTCVNDKFENYEGEVDCYDAVLAIHTVYHFLPNITAMVKQALQPLKPGGKLFFAFFHGMGIQEMMVDKKGALGNFITRLAEKMGDVLTDMELNYLEDNVDGLLLDLNDEGQGYYDFLEMPFNGNVTREQKESVIFKMKMKCLPGTMKFPIDQAAFVITK